MTNSTNGSNTKESKNYWMDDNKNYRMDDSMLIQIASILARTGAARLYLSDDQLAFLSHFVTHLPDFLAFIQNPTDFGSNHNLPDTLPTDNSTDFFIELAYLIHFMVMDQFLPQLLDPQLQSSILPSLSLLPSIQDLDVDSFDQPIPDSFYNAYLPVDSIFYTLEHDADLIPFLHTYEPHEDIDEPTPPVSSPRKNSKDSSKNNNTQTDSVQDNEKKSEQGQSGHNQPNSVVSQNNTQDNEIEAPEATPKPEIEDFAVDAPVGLKYMLAMIKKQTPPNLKYIKKIITDATPSKSKWANDERDGQEQLYEALEKVLNSLKNYHEHSQPFLKPVNKRDAPTYYDVIKHPMDLSTMAKKLKSLEYASKADFVKDLDLIWDNCLTFNTMPESIYRKRAMAMRRRSTELLKKIPDILVQSGEASESDGDDDDVKAEESIKQPLTTLLPKEEVKSDIGLVTVVEEPIVKKEILENVKIEEMVQESTEMELEPSICETFDIPMDIDLLHRSSVDNTHQGQQMQEDPTYDSNILIRKWKEVTITQHIANGKQRELETQLPFEERPAIIRTEKSMSNYLAAINDFKLRNTHRRSIFLSNSEFDIETLELESKKQKLNCPELFNPLGPFPPSCEHIPPFHSDMLDFFVDEFEERRVPVAPLPSMSEYPEFQYDTSSRLNATMMNNVKEYKRIKEIHNFIVSKQNGVDLDSVTALPVSTPYTRVYPREALPKPLVTFESSIGLAKQVSGHILAHTGFDSVTDSALSTFADIFMELLFTAGKTMRAYMDEHGNDMTIEEILSLVLVELGILDCGELQKYINHELVGFGKKLYDLRRKLESAWTEFGQLIKSADEEGDVQLDEDGIMSGRFLQDLNIDFMNLKEFGVDMGQIPPELWKRNMERQADRPIQGRVRRAIVAQVLPTVEDDNSASVGLPPIEAWEPVSSSTVIGLLRGFYEQLEMIPDGMIEDEMKPKSKEMKMMVKMAMTGGRKKLNSTTPKKKMLDAAKAALQAKKLAAKKEKMRLKELKKMKKGLVDSPMAVDSS